MKPHLLVASLFISFTSGLMGQSTERTISISEKYLNLPVNQSEAREEMTLTFEDGTVRKFVIRLSDGSPDYWVFVDLTTFQNQDLKINYPSNRQGIAQIYQSAEITGADSLYQETYRPRFHFSSKRGWNNDPNGLVYANGVYHLFYQHNPYEIFWENMHWGHATSTDLIHWEEQGDVLYPDSLGTMFSGSAVVDEKNTAGFQQGTEDVLVAIYTAHRPGHEVQCLAYSNDEGKTWRKYKNNPVLDSKERWESGNTRDPKVFWHEETDRWVMVLFEKDGHSIYTSTDLKGWIYQSHQPGFWECPELIQMPVDGDENHMKWVMYGASGTYFIGDFDGEQFVIESGKHNYYSGPMYAAQTFSNSPGYPSPVIQIGWAQISHPEMPFNQMMAFPTQLSLKSTRNGIRLCSKPIDGIEKLYARSWKWTDLDVSGANEVLQETEGDLFQIKMKVEMIEGIAFDLQLDGNLIASYSFNHNKLNGAFYAGDQMEDRMIDLEILVDKTSIEVFADDGQFTVLSPRQEAKNNAGLQFAPRKDQVKIHALEVHRLKTAW